MLEVVSTLRSPSCKADLQQHCGFVVGDHHHADAAVFPTTSGDCCDGGFGGMPSMVEVDDDNLLDYIDFSCDVPFFDDADGDILPDLEVDPTTDELLAEIDFSSPAPVVVPDDDDVKTKQQAEEKKKRLSLEEQAEQTTCGDGGEKSHVISKQQATTTTTTEEEDYSTAGSGSGVSSASAAEGSKKKAATTTGKNKNNSHGGKRKVKVDWTPELHRRFVQAVEQLGIDKAVPSRILEIMGMDCLTRHNIASHLQKYRSHRKHLMAREAEAATWAQKRHMYAAAAAVAGGATDAAHGGRPWVVPATIGFPPAAPPPFCRPLHVWGHPPSHAAAATTPEAAAAAAPAPAPAAMLPVWPRHLAPPRPMPPWAHRHPPAFWHQQYNNAVRKWGPQAAAVTQGTPYVPPPAAAAMLPRFPVPPGMVPPPHPIPMYRPQATMVPPPPPPPPPPCSKLAELQLVDLDAHPSKESIDAAIGDVLVKPWLPLPLGLKPPSLDSVMSELHKQGVPTIPPAAATATG